MKTLFAALILLLSSSCYSYASHDPSEDIGKFVHISAWCNTLEDTKKLMKLRIADETDKMLDMYLKSPEVEGGSSCVNVHILRKMMPNNIIPFPKVEILDIVEEMEGDNETIAIAKMKRFNGSIVYSWHPYPSNDV